MSTDWKAVQKALDDRNEAERVARNARSDAAIDKAMANLDKVPEHDLMRVLWEADGRGCCF